MVSAVRELRIHGENLSRFRAKTMSAIIRMMLMLTNLPYAPCISPAEASRALLRVKQCIAKSEEGNHVKRRITVLP